MAGLMGGEVWVNKHALPGQPGSTNDGINPGRWDPSTGKWTPTGSGGNPFKTMPGSPPFAQPSPPIRKPGAPAMPMYGGGGEESQTRFSQRAAPGAVTGAGARGVQTSGVRPMAEGGQSGGVLESLLMRRAMGGLPTPPQAPNLVNPPFRGDLALPEAMDLMRRPETEASVRDLMLARQPEGLEQLLMMQQLRRRAGAGMPRGPHTMPDGTPMGGSEPGFPQFNPLDRAAGALTRPR